MWIRDYRNANNLELYELQYRVNMYSKMSKSHLHGHVSAKLIHMLEVDEHTVTHPRIANMIALICEATPEQRDMIVSINHRGKWEPTEKERGLAKEINDKLNHPELIETEVYEIPNVDVNTPGSRRGVVKIDMYGNTIARYSSIRNAIRRENPPYNYYEMIKSRCARRIKREYGEFKTSRGTVNMKYTFRYAKEWDRMSPKQKVKDAQRTIKGDDKE